MFRAQMSQLANGPTLTLEGRLVGAWVEQARTLLVKDRYEWRGRYEVG